MILYHPMYLYILGIYRADTGYASILVWRLLDGGCHNFLS